MRTALHKSSARKQGEGGTWHKGDTEVRRGFSSPRRECDGRDWSIVSPERESPCKAKENSKPRNDDDDFPLQLVQYLNTLKNASLFKGDLEPSAQSRGIG